MDLVDRADRAKARGNTEPSLKLLRQALSYEMAAIDKLPEPRGLGWSILLRSAATIALESGNDRVAEKLASTALAGDPHPEVIEEIRDVWERANFHRHLEFTGTRLGSSEVQLSLVGSAAAGGMTYLSELLTRADSFQKLVHRIAQRHIYREYTSKVPNEVKSGYSVFAAAPKAGSFTIAIKLGHSPEQASFPGMFGTEDVLSEFLDLMELADSSRDQEIQRRISNPHYLQNFVGLGRKLAPDGKRIRQVGFTLVNGEMTRSLSVTTPASRFLPPKIESRGYSARVVEASGILRFADASRRRPNRIRLDNADGSHQEILVPQGLMDDIVQPMWNSHVTVKGSLRPRQKIIRLFEIWESDPDSGQRISSQPAVLDAHGGLQQSFP